MRRTYVFSMLTAAALSAAQVQAQTPNPQVAPPQPSGGVPSPALVSACVEAQQQVAGLASQINGRLEDARQTNNPEQMRAALADLQAAVVEIRTRAEQCSPLTAAAQAAGGHAGHAMGTAASPSPGTSVMPPAGTTTPGPASRPAKPAPQPADPHAAHDTGKPVASKPAVTPSPPRSESKQTVDPVCGKAVDPATAPSTAYKGVTYYFCSLEDRLRFIRNPETYLKKTKR